VLELSAFPHSSVYSPKATEKLKNEKICLLSRFGTGGEVDFRRDVLVFSSKKDACYSPLRREKWPFLWYLSPLFDLATSIKNSHEAVGFMPSQIASGLFTTLHANAPDVERFLKR
jgi:hypothetical protein